MTGQLLTVRQVADQFGVSTRTVKRWRARGLIRKVAVCGTVRYPASDIERLLTAKQQ